MDENTISSPGRLIKAELVRRGLSQKSLAAYLGISASHTSEIINGRRGVTVRVAEKLEDWLGISASTIMECQCARDLVRKSANGQTGENSEALRLLEQFDEIVSVRSLLQGTGAEKRETAKRLALLRELYSLSTPTALSASLNSLSGNCFRKSAVQGLDKRMVYTWVVKARAEAMRHKPDAAFSEEKAIELPAQLSAILHANSDTVDRVSDALSACGIGFAIVEKEKSASIDGYSFMSDNTPYIVVTCRYDRIDNFAFTVMHELGHVLSGHLSACAGRLNVEVRDSDRDNEDSKETQADRFAMEALIPSALWGFAPSVPLFPYVIQSRYSYWAERNGLNKWIVLGRVSHDTGMYRFTSGPDRHVSGLARKKKGGKMGM